jgi:predicted RNA-binding protein associated with RNAse of E/G family
MPAITPTTVIKRNFQGDETWRYSGILVRRQGSALHIHAPFNGKDSEFMGITIKNGDPFVEVYYTDRWYNIFEIHDQEDGHLKGWYCNVGKPAVEEAGGAISYIDLALDLWVAPDGTQTVLDEAEFAALDLDAETCLQARAALKELLKLFADGKPPDLS